MIMLCAEPFITYIPMNVETVDPCMHVVVVGGWITSSLLYCIHRHHYPYHHGEVAGLFLYFLAVA
jgi:hypothetical protein